MRLLHTSDWHLGRSFHNQSLREAQEAFVDFLVETVTEHGVDVVLVAGDLYDRAIPPVDAVAVFDRALSQLAALGVAVVLISGNHDSTARLQFGNELFATANVHLRTQLGSKIDPVVLNDSHGPVLIYPIPYLEPELTWVDLEAIGPRHDAVLSAAMDGVRDNLASHPAGTRSVILAHGFVGDIGSSTLSESERDINVGGTAIVPAAVFEGADYVALGHLHGFQQPVPDRIVYSGSPIAYSFSEQRHTKSVTLVDLAADGSAHTEQLPVPVWRSVSSIEGTLESLLNDPRWAAYEGHWLSITLTDETVPPEPMGRLRRRFAHVLQLVVTVRTSVATGSYRERIEGLSDLAMFERFVNDMWNRPPDPTEDELLARSLRSVAAADALR